MPAYSYFCTEGHETTRFFKHEDRPKTSHCNDCNKKASYRPTVSKHQGLTPPGVNMKSADEFKGMSLHDFHCDKCDYRFDEIIDFGAGETSSDGCMCPKCGMQSRWVPSCKIDRDSERYPRFDRGLGMWLTSKKHRQDVCGNPRKYGIDANKIIPVDGDWDSEDYTRKLKTEDDKLKKDYEDYVDLLENSPAFKGYRKSRDQGRVS